MIFAKFSKTNLFIEPLRMAASGKSLRDIFVKTDSQHISAQPVSAQQKH